MKSRSEPFMADTISYINRQAEHHRTATLEDDFVRFFKRHDIDYNENHVWG